jgi:hypothetical protein
VSSLQGFLRNMTKVCATLSAHPICRVFTLGARRLSPVLNPKTRIWIPPSFPTDITDRDLHSCTAPSRLSHEVYSWITNDTAPIFNLGSLMIPLPSSIFSWSSPSCSWLHTWDLLFSGLQTRKKRKAIPRKLERKGRPSLPSFRPAPSLPPRLPPSLPPSHPLSLSPEDTKHVPCLAQDCFSTTHAEGTQLMW